MTKFNVYRYENFNREWGNDEFIASFDTEEEAEDYIESRPVSIYSDTTLYIKEQK